MRRLLALSTAMRMMDKPIVAKCAAFVSAAAQLEINLFCDMTVATKGCQIRSGRPRVDGDADLERLSLLARYVGERKARELYTCRLYSARGRRSTHGAYQSGLFRRQAR